MATEFDQLLASINLTDDEVEAIEIRADRTFILPEGYNTTIAYEGDVNSQIVRFKVPNKHEGYSLSACANKKLTWYNKDTKASGVSDLKQEDMDLLVWYVPAEVLAKAGALDISISLYSIDTSGKVTFAWNTGTFSQLKIASTMDTINSYPFAEDLRIPNKDEILFINLEGRNIVAPKGFNTTVANFGEEGLASVYFQMNNQFKNWDLSVDTVTVTILSIINENKVVQTIDKENFFAEGTPGDRMLCFKWDVPSTITTGLIGPFTIAIIIEDNNPDNKKVWRSSPYRELKIGETETYPDNEYAPIPATLTKYVGAEENG